jgi:hypothetical protein
MQGRVIPASELSAKIETWDGLCRNIPILRVPSCRRITPAPWLRWRCMPASYPRRRSRGFPALPVPNPVSRLVAFRRHARAGDDGLFRPDRPAGNRHRREKAIEAGGSPCSHLQSSGRNTARVWLVRRSTGNRLFDASRPRGIQLAGAAAESSRGIRNRGSARQVATWGRCSSPPWNRIGGLGSRIW